MIGDFQFSEGIGGRRGFYNRGVHFFVFYWEWDIGFWYFRRWR